LNGALGIARLVSIDVLQAENECSESCGVHVPGSFFVCIGLAPDWIREPGKSNIGLRPTNIRDA
jgi:hypothetical protein